MNDEETRKYMRDYYLRNRDKINARRRVRERVSNKEYDSSKRNAYARKYYEEHREKILAYQRERREKKNKEEWILY